MMVNQARAEKKLGVKQVKKQSRWKAHGVKQLIYAVVFTLVLVFMHSVLLCAQIKAVAHKPVVSGNYEQGWRLYEAEEGTGDDYFFRVGWLKWKHDLSSKSYYYIRTQYSQNDFTSDSKYDSRTIDLQLNYTQQIVKAFRVKTELNLRQKVYELDPKKDYFEVGANLEFNLKPGAKDNITATLKVQQENYPTGVKDNLVTGVNLDWQRKMWTGFSVNTGASMTTEKFYDESVSSSDKMRYAISVGFEYQL